MSKKSKTYTVESKTVDNLKWDDLIRTNEEAMVSVKNISVKLTELVTVVNKDTSDLELSKLIDGMSNSIISVRNKIIDTSKLHGTMKEDGLYLFSGPVNIDDKKHTELYLNVISIYADIGRIIKDEIADKYITAIMERYNTVMSAKVAEPKTTQGETIGA